ncbi:MAG TPA: hypothetical protein PK129_11280 [Cellvibrionaceae bacterium]|nr:hypothetical protein [Cellvibrionaceae bacterium]
MTQATQNSTRVTAIQTLYEEVKAAIQTTTRSQYTLQVLDAIFSKPIFRSSDLAQTPFKEFATHEKPSPGLLRQMKDAGILRELQAGKCYELLANPG